MLGRARVQKLAERDLAGIPEAVTDVGGKRRFVHQSHGEQCGGINFLA